MLMYSFFWVPNGNKMRTLIILEFRRSLSSVRVGVFPRSFISKGSIIILLGGGFCIN